MALTVGDLTQYFGFCLRIVQELAYLYGFYEIDSHSQDEAVHNELVLFLGVMFAVNGAKNGIAFIAKGIGNHAEKVVAHKALTKGFVYPIVKKVAKVLGQKMTKEMFGKAIGKAVPVAGGAVSAGITYVSFLKGSERLQNVLKTYGISDPDFYAHQISSDVNEKQIDEG